MTVRPLVWLGAALSLSACIDLAPRYHRPQAPVPAAFPIGGAYPQPAAPAPVVRWRDVFLDAKLKAIIDEALANNRDLRIAVANIAAARGQYQVQRSDLLPKLNANLGGAFGQTPASVVGRGAAGGGRGELNERVYDANVAVSAYQLDLFGKVRNLTKAALDQYFATREARDAAQITLIAQVAADDLTLGADRALLAIAKDTEKSGRATLALTQARFSGGIASQLDVSHAQTVVQQARSDVARLTTQVAQDKNALDLVVGAPVAEDLLADGVDDPGIAVARLPAGLPSTILLERPDVAQAEDRLKAANANIGAARAAFFPSLSLTGSGGFTSLALSTLFRGASAAWSFAPRLSAPIFDAGANRGNLRVARAQRDAAVASYEKAIQTAFREVADALARRGTIEEQLAAQQALVAASADAYRLSNARYESGVDTYLNALIAQRALYVARQSLVATQLARADNLVTLYTAFGGGVN